MTQPARTQVPTGEQRHRRAVFTVTALGAFLASLDLSIVNVAFPSLQRSFPTVSTAGLSWVITGYAIVFAALLVTAGRTADLLGRRRLFLAGLLLFTAASAACGAAPTVPVLVAARVVQAVGAALLLPASLGLLLEAYSAQARAQAVALWGGVGALAVATGPSLGAAIVSAGGWRWAFYVNLPVAAAAVAAGVRVLPAGPRARSATRPDYLGVLLVSAALGGLVLAVAQGPRWGWTSGRTGTALAVGVVLGTAFLRRCRRHPAPVVDPGLFRARTFALANAATLVYAMGFFAMLLGNILFLTGVWHYTILRAGLAVTPGPLVVAAVSGPAGRLAHRVGFAPVLTVGFAVFTLGLSSYVLLVGGTPHYLGTWLPGSLITGLGIGLTFPVLAAAAVSALQPAQFAVGSAVNQTARQVGGAVGVALLVAILGRPHSPAAALTAFRHLWSSAAGTGLAALLIAPWIHPRRAPAAARPAVPAAVERAADPAVRTG